MPVIPLVIVGDVQGRRGPADGPRPRCSRKPRRRPCRRARWRLASFDPFAPGHAAGCACCAGRSPAAVALDRLFQARVRGACSWFDRVVALAETARRRATRSRGVARRRGDGGALPRGLSRRPRDRPSARGWIRGRSLSVRRVAVAAADRALHRDHVEPAPELGARRAHDPDLAEAERDVEADGTDILRVADHREDLAEAAFLAAAQAAPRPAPCRRPGRGCRRGRRRSPRRRTYRQSAGGTGPGRRSRGSPRPRPWPPARAIPFPARRRCAAPSQPRPAAPPRRCRCRGARDGRRWR